MSSKGSKKRITVVGLYTLPNMGDRILCDATEYLIKSFDSSYEVVHLDVNPRYEWQYVGFDHFKYEKSRGIKRRLERHYKYEDSTFTRYRLERFMWRLREYSLYKETLRDVDAIVFCGGGFVKFRTQGLNYYVEMVMEIARKRKIPVMMNGIGVEGYDDKDIRCRELKKRLNYEVMKYITTRDDLNTLRKYITRDDIVTDSVGDPAFWSPECYGVERDESSAKVGINCIREKIFGEYGNSSSPEEVHEFYVGLIKELKERGIAFELFTNGMPADHKMGEGLVNELELPEDILVKAPEDGETLMDTVASYRAVFGARLHACITAFSLGIPVSGMIWNEKARFFSEITGRKEYFFEEEDLDPVKAADAIERSIKEASPEDMKKVRDSLRDKTKNRLFDFLKEYA